ncbi:MAG: DegT/DnrJ/EryC1/StrS family aminotransferase [Lentisphaerae bacterium]|nr:DegT/DnrJ/EryC1/StrS family aminotransferase [Victivallaceae bacterium]MDD3703470.1 DegT/DnrJ/EryC1/StrS family aminotransferase [Victivallaceae bacterium]MDD5664403.1 DegT/DnrJ/EryC1/StrS family aminotransferase [Victivallaceae bacterium]NLK83351.1 DegT/DnrJ/EryC1/StrS family aminotransferase [Lentisphaerota bacterium]
MAVKKATGKVAAPAKAAAKKGAIALEGGAKVWNEPFPMWPSFEESTIQKAMEPLRSGLVNYWTGPVGKKFEDAWAKWLGVKNAMSVTNGTAALHVALASLGIGPGDEVICPSYSFIASSFAILQAGALPVFADVAKDHLIDPKDIEDKITEHTKAIIVVHLYGMVADMDPIMAIAKKHNLKVVEDCAQCFGGIYKGKKAGTIGHAGCFSFCQSKHFTTGGEGGMVVTDNDDLAWECRSFRDHGYDVKERLNLLEMEGKLLYIHKRVGFNFRMTEMQSQIGLCELERFDKWNLKNRIRNGKMLLKALGKHPLVLHAPVDTKDRQNSYWWAPFVLDLDKMTCDIKTFIKAIAAEGVPVYSVLWPEMYKEKAYVERNGFGVAKYPFFDPKARNIDYTQFDCKTAHWMTDRTMCFFTHPVYNEAHMQACIDAFNKVADFYMKKK